MIRIGALGTLPFQILRPLLDGVITVREIEIREAMRAAAFDAHVVLEPAGAAALAAWLFHLAAIVASGPIVCVATGGSVDPAFMARVLGGWPAREGTA